MFNSLGRLRRKRRALGLESLESRLTPATATWDGGGANNQWTTAANWVGDVVPQAGDQLTFPPGAAQPANLNDFAVGAAFQSLTVSGSQYSIFGNAITLGGVFADIPANESSTLALPLGGVGGLTKSGGGTLILSGDNTYLNVTQVNAGFLEVRSNSALGAIGPGHDTVVADGATLAFAGTLNVPEAITINELVTTEANAFAIRIRPNSNVTLSGPLTVAAAANSSAAIVFGDSGQTSFLTITSGVGESGGVGDIRFDTLTVTFAPSSVNMLTGQTQVSDGGTAFFNGQGGSSPVVNVGFALIGGTGTIGPVTVGGFGSGANISAADDMSVGTLTTGNFQLLAHNFPVGGDGFLIVNLASSGGIASADRVIVNGTVRLGGFLALRPSAGLILPPNGHFVIVANDGTDAVLETFHGLPEGETTPLANGNAVRITYHGGDGNDVELISTPPPKRYAVAEGSGGVPQVNVYDRTGLLYSIMAYNPAFRGGVRVAMGDINGDGVPDVVTAPGPGGGPDIRVFDGVTNAIINEFLAYDPAFTGGVFVALGDVSGDGFLDLVTGAGAGGGPHVKAFFASNGLQISSFFAYAASFTGGVSVATGDVTGDGISEIITGPGRGGGPHVRVFNGAGTPLSEFLAYDSNFFGGIFVAAGDVNGDGVAEIITGPGAGGGPHVKALNGLTGVTIASFLAYDPNFLGGVTVATTDLDGDGRAEILTGAGPSGGPHTKIWRLSNNTVTLQSSFFAFDPAFIGGIYVG